MELFAFFKLVNCRNSLHILNPSSVSDICILNIFCQRSSLDIHFNNSVFDEQTFLVFDEFQFNLFYFIVVPSHVLSMKPLPILKSCRYSVFFFQGLHSISFPISNYFSIYCGEVIEIYFFIPYRYIVILSHNIFYTFSESPHFITRC